MKVFVIFAFLARWFIHVFRTVYFLVNARVVIGVGWVIHFPRDSLEVTLLERLRSKFEKPLSLLMYPLEFLLPGILLFLEVFSIFLLGVRHLRSLVEEESYCLSLWGLLRLFPWLLSNSSIKGKRVVISAGGRLEIFYRSFLGFPSSIIVMFDGVHVFIEPLIG